MKSRRTPHPIEIAPSAPTTPRYQGRILPRPDDELVDQGLYFDATTLLTRRRVLGVLGAGLGVAGLAACGVTATGAEDADTTDQAAANPAEIPDETAGPYPGDGSNGPDVLTQSGIVRSDIRSSFGESTGTAEGVPMTLELTVTDLAGGGGGFAGVAVYVWHCDRSGGYSMYSEGVTDQNYLRGVQVADADGLVRFTSIVPACYAGRWPHVHFEVYPDVDAITDHTTAIATSQLALPAEVCEVVYAEPGYEQSVTNLAGVSLQTDGIFSDGGGADQVATVTGDVDAGYIVSLLVPVDTTTEPTSGGMGGGPDGGTGGTDGGPGGAGGGPQGDEGPGGDGGTPPEGTPPSGDRPS